MTQAYSETIPYNENVLLHSKMPHKRTDNVLPGGGGGGGMGEPFAQKILPRCPYFYETVEKKRGSYDGIGLHLK